MPAACPKHNRYNPRSRDGDLDGDGYFPDEVHGLHLSTSNGKENFIDNNCDVDIAKSNPFARIKMEMDLAETIEACDIPKDMYRMTMIVMILMSSISISSGDLR